MKQIALDIGLATGPSFQNFVAGANQDALSHLMLWVGVGSASSSVAHTLRSAVPTYLWGSSGSGKTHLLKAVREALRGPGAQVGWLDAATLEPPAFSEHWAAVVLDDVHLYTAVQQQAAFNWFINAQTAQRWVVGAGVLPPTDLPLRDDLKSRLGWGHVFALKVLTEPERRSVLRQDADARGVFLSDEVMAFLLTRFSRDLGSLMEMLNLLDGYALQSKRAITVPMVKAMMEDN